MTAKAQLADLAARLRLSADLYRRNANTQDRDSINVECLADLPEDEAAVSLEKLKKMRPKWFVLAN